MNKTFRTPFSVVIQIRTSSCPPELLVVYVQSLLHRPTVASSSESHPFLKKKKTKLVYGLLKEIRGAWIRKDERNMQEQYIHHTQYIIELKLEDEGRKSKEKKKKQFFEINFKLKQNGMTWWLINYRDWWRIIVRVLRTSVPQSKLNQKKGADKKHIYTQNKREKNDTCWRKKHWLV